jgi:hypothetical protein
MRLKLLDKPEDVIEHYKLRNIATPDGYVYCEIRQGMYGLPQAGIIAQEPRTLSQKVKGARLLTEQDHAQPVETQVATNHFLPRRQQFRSKIGRQGTCPAFATDGAKIL